MIRVISRCAMPQNENTATSVRNVGACLSLSLCDPGDPMHAWGPIPPIRVRYGPYGAVLEYSK